MKSLKEKFEEQVNESRNRVKNLVAEYGDKIVGEISLRQIYSGMRGMLSMVTETSKLDPNEGIRFRGYSLPEIQLILLLCYFFLHLSLIHICRCRRRG